MQISWWPHWWAIPLTFFIGMLLGWLLRAQLDDGAGTGPPRKRPPAPRD